jgi:sulfur carrier protein ThiS
MKRHVKVKLKNINFGEKEIELDTRSVRELLNKISTNDESVILAGENGKIYTKDMEIEDGSVINVIEVFSGG